MINQKKSMNTIIQGVIFDTSDFKIIFKYKKNGMILDCTFLQFGSFKDKIKFLYNAVLIVFGKKKLYKIIYDYDHLDNKKRS